MHKLHKNARVCINCINCITSKSHGYAPRPASDAFPSWWSSDGWGGGIQLGESSRPDFRSVSYDGGYYCSAFVMVPPVSQTISCKGRGRFKRPGCAWQTVSPCLICINCINCIICTNCIICCIWSLCPQQVYLQMRTALSIQKQAWQFHLWYWEDAQHSTCAKWHRPLGRYWQHGCGSCWTRP